MQTLTIMNNASAANIQKLLDIGKILGIQLRWDTTIESMDFEKIRVEKQQKKFKAMLRQGLEEMELCRKGKLKPKSLDELLNELD